MASEMKLSDYVEEIEKNPSLIESSPDRILRVMNKGSKNIKGYKIKEYPKFRDGDHKIMGLTDILNSIIGCFETASRVKKRGQLPVILVCGPPGSGKTEIGRCLDEHLIDDLIESPKYSLVLFDEEKEYECKFKEDPIHILTSHLAMTPKNIRDQFKKDINGELCPLCLKDYQRISRNFFQDIDLKNIEVKDYLQILDKFVKVVKLTPQIASGDLLSPKFETSLKQKIVNANRGIMHFDLNDSRFSDVPENNYQSILRMTDGRMVLQDGLSFDVDLVVLMYSNWEPTDISKGAFKDRLIPLYVRRALSLKTEKHIYSLFEFPFKHKAPHSIDTTAHMAVGSRFKSISHVAGFEKLIRLYDLYESKSPLLNDNEKKEIDAKLGLEKGQNKVPEDGWSEGVSARTVILKELSKFNPEKGDCLYHSLISDWIDEGDLGTYPTGLKQVSNSFLESKMVRDVVLSYVYIKNGNKDEIPKLFDNYLNILEEKAKNNASEITYKGQQRLVDEALSDIEKELCIKNTKSQEFQELIFQCIDENIYERPNYERIIELNPQLISSDSDLTTYLPWEKIKSDSPLAEPEVKRKKEFINIMETHLDYCKICANDTLEAIAGKFIGENKETPKATPKKPIYGFKVGGGI